MVLPGCLVTVYCLTYNHEKYIRKTLEGFVSQKTSFRYCVIIHDDASTDSTQEIIKEYVKKYPSLFIPILQEDNQFSKGVRIFSTFIRPLIQGKYIALCEGDDYWCSSDKLQMQFDYMEEHPNCTLCVHNSRIVQESGALTDSWFNYSSTDKDYSVDEVIRAKGGGLFHTSSFFYRSRDINVPKEFIVKGIGDYNRAIFLASKGYVHYCPKVMSCYRTGSVNSWVKEQHSDTGKIIEFNKQLVEGLYRMASVLGADHIRAIDDAVGQYLLDIFLYQQSKLRVVIKPKLWLHAFRRLIRNNKKRHLRKMYIKKEDSIEQANPICV